jgi:hypothetical protein
MKSSNQTNFGDLKRRIESVHEGKRGLGLSKEATMLIGGSEKATCVFRVYCKNQIESDSLYIRTTDNLIFGSKHD